SAGDERASAKERRGVALEREGAIGELARFAELAERIPEPVERADEAERELGTIVAADGPAGARAEVVLLGDQLGDQRRRIRAADEIRSRGLDHAEVVVDVAQLLRGALARLLESLEPILPHRLEEPVPRDSVARL